MASPKDETDPFFDPLSAPLESRVIVLEIMMMTCLGMLLDNTSGADRSESLTVLSSITETVTARCREMDVPVQVQFGAERYAETLTKIIRLSLLQ